MEFLNTILDFLKGPLNDFAWMYTFLPCAILGGLFLTIRNGGVQFLHFGHAMKNTVGKMFQKQEAGEGAVTPMQAVTTALSATVGTGNIVGTSQAIALGGYGAVFWLWLAALVGMVTKYSEIVLAIKFRERDAKGDWVGGPMYYISKGLGKKWKWLAVLFAAFASLACFGIGNMSQVNSITGSVINAVEAFTTISTGTEMLLKWILGLGLAALVAIILLGGIKRIGAVTEKLIPFMSIFYILFTLVVIGTHLGGLGEAFMKIFSTAFTPEALFGASTGIVLKQTIIWGLRRSAFSNEAGLGSAAIAHAAAETKGPVNQGLYGIFEVFIDTIVICSLTALAIISSGVPIEFGVKPGSELITAALATVFGAKFAALFVAFALMLFAFSTVLGWSLYGTRCVQYLFGHKGIHVFQVVFIVVVVVGCVSPLEFVWDVADTFNGLMAIPNFVGLFALSGVVAAETRKYFGDRSNLY
ncbi:MAG: sodium:alanine symporter family protein [Oscillibacter sp.]|jgi:AGCS family alanine or glycine:cation symporter|nr:sodium:alanine symporter family protein [Oscillibacter sp.]